MRRSTIAPLLSAALLAAASLTPPAAAQIVPPRAWPPGPDLPGRLGATTEAQPLVPALPAWQVPVLTPYVNLWSGGLVLGLSITRATSRGFDWDLCFFYNSTRSAEIGVLGHGWRHSYEITLLLDTPPGSITVRWGDDRRDVFSPSGGGWDGPPALEGRTITTIADGYRLATKHGDSFEFNTSGQLIRLVDRHGNTTTLTYLGGRIIRITDPSNRQVTFSYFGGRMNKIDSPVGGLLGTPIFLGYSSDHLVTVNQLDGYPFSFQYDGISRLVQITDARGRSTHVGYHPSLMAVEWVRAEGARREFFFNSANLNTVVRDSVDAGETSQASYVFNADGTTASVSQADLGTASSTYDPSTLKLLSHTDPNGHTWSRTYGTAGDLLTVTSPLTETWTWTYDPVYHLPLTLTEPGTPPWQWTRDGSGNATGLTDPTGNPWTATYNSQGLMETLTDPNSNTTTYAYDGAARLITVTDAASNSRQFLHDAWGDVHIFTDEQSNAWSVHRDVRGSVTRLNEPGGNYYTLEWWPDGTLKRSGDAEGGGTEYSYDALDRVVRREGPWGVVTIERDGKGKEKRSTDGEGSQTETKRDGAGRPTEEKDPDGGTTEYHYDGLDRDVMMLPDGTAIEHRYDPRHRLVERSCGPDTTRYEYDALDRLVRAVRTDPPAPPIEYRYAYDAIGRLIRKETVHLGRVLEYTLDPGGRVMRMEDNLQPTPWDCGYDNRDLLTSLTALSEVQVNQTYGTRREPMNTSLSPTGASIYRTYDANRRPTYLGLSAYLYSSYWQPTWSLRGDLAGYSGYSPAGGSVTMSATYDSARLVITEDHGTLGAFAFAYDNAGNRVAKNGPGGFESYSYDAAHRLLSAGTLTQTWNVNGDVLTSGWPGHPIAYAYRPDRSLASVTDSGSMWRMVPGPFDEIAAMVAPAGDTTWFDSDAGNGGLLRRATFAARASAPSAEYGFLPPISGTTPLFRKAQGNVQALLPGPFGIADVVDNNIGLVSSRYYSMFGEILALQGAPSATPGFTDMDVLREPNGPLLNGVSERGPRGATGDLAYLPRTGSYQRDLGFGTDVFPPNGVNILDLPHGLDPPPLPPATPPRPPIGLFMLGDIEIVPLTLASVPPAPEDDCMSLLNDPWILDLFFGPEPLFRTSVPSWWIPPPFPWNLQQPQSAGCDPGGGRAEPAGKPDDRDYGRGWKQP